MTAIVLRENNKETSCADREARHDENERVGAERQRQPRRVAWGAGNSGKAPGSSQDPGTGVSRRIYCSRRHFRRERDRGVLRSD